MEETLDEFAFTTTKKHGFASDIVFEILTWLPAKSLMRFKCVSKAWNSLIQHDDDLDFVKLYNAHSHARPSATRLLFELAIRKPYGDVVERTQLEGFPLQLACPRHLDSREMVICSNHCNGLVCLYSHKDTQVYLYNVTTREIKALPFTKRNPKGWHHKLYLGFDLNTEKYKLLHVIRSMNKPYYKTNILTLGTNSWKRIEESYPNNSCYSEDYIYLNGVLYWSHNDMKDTMTYFNFIEEKFGTLSLPHGTNFYIVKRMQTVLWGKLVVYCHYGTINDGRNMVYDEVNKVFMKFNLDLKEKKVVLLEAENIDETIESSPKVILATSSLISTSTSLIFPDPFSFCYISSFVENIISLTFIEV